MLELLADLLAEDLELGELRLDVGALLAKGHVVTPGRTLTVTRGEVYAADGTHVASMQQTLLMLAGTPDTPA